MFLNEASLWLGVRRHFIISLRSSIWSVKTLGKEWINLADKDKVEFLEMHQEAKVKYMEDKAAFLKWKKVWIYYISTRIT